ncbi:S1 family peptidase [Streptomyces sp. G45]|uniref:S1 family peptidase n=1 Tax=Streptomyces sp. G45 TaxID=3406627 RepID=UPI003C176E87
MRHRRIVVRLLCAALVALGPLAAAPGATADTTAQAVVRGGDPLYRGGGGRCTVGFNATDGRDFYGIMDGQCGSVGTQWYADPRLTIPVGVTETAVFPGSDYSLLRYTNRDVSYPSEVRYGSGGLRINDADRPVVGQQVCRTGPTTGTHCGTIQSLNSTVTYPQGVVYGLIRTNVCAEPGDSGGPAFSGDSAVGVLVGGSGNCASGGTTFYQPVAPILSRHGLRVGY